MERDYSIADERKDQLLAPNSILLADYDEIKKVFLKKKEDAKCANHKGNFVQCVKVLRFRDTIRRDKMAEMTGATYHGLKRILIVFQKLNLIKSRQPRHGYYVMPKFHRFIKLFLKEYPDYFNETRDAEKVETEKTCFIKQEKSIEQEEKSTAHYRKRVVVPSNIFSKRRLRETAKQQKQIKLVRAFWQGKKLTPHQRSQVLVLIKKSELIENKNIFTKKNKLFRQKTSTISMPSYVK